jgi:hypothetical protein
VASGNLAFFGAVTQGLNKRDRRKGRGGGRAKRKERERRKEGREEGGWLKGRDVRHECENE